MPLIGHALVGWATALESRHPRAARGAALWAPAVIATAYLPDVVGQLGLLAGWPDAPRAGHSLLFAVAAAPVVAAALASAGGVSFLRAWIVGCGTLLLHDLLDVLQSTDRQPWWPFSVRPLILERPLIPESPRGEALLFGGLFLAYLVVRRLRPRHEDAPPARRSWAVHSFTIALVLAAVATHGLRERRERRFEEARQRIEQGDPRAGLELLDEAASWPSTARPGRADYLKGEAYARLGDREAAERSYLRSLQADPGYFWAIADLAAFYAGGPEPQDVRRGRAAPLLLRLREQHPRHPALGRAEQRIERSLARPGPVGPTLDKEDRSGRN